MPHFDDIIPFMKKKTKDLADKVEENRKKIREDNRKSGTGTLMGLEKIILKRKKEIEDASSYSD